MTGIVIGKKAADYAVFLFSVSCIAILGTAAILAAWAYGDLKSKDAARPQRRQRPRQ